MSDTDKLVAAILAAAKMSATGERASPDLYIAEYLWFREALRKMETEELQEPAVPEVIEALEKAQNLGGEE